MVWKNDHNSVAEREVSLKVGKGTYTWIFKEVLFLLVKTQKHLSLQ